MNGVEGVGDSDILRRLLSEAAQSIRPASERALEEESEDKPGMEGALSLSRRYLSQSLQGSGFVDIHADSIARMEAFVEQSRSEPEEAEIELDPKMASEIAGHVGAEITGDVNQILRILARVHPDRVAMLLRQT